MWLYAVLLFVNLYQQAVETTGTREVDVSVGSIIYKLDPRAKSQEYCVTFG